MSYVEVISVTFQHILRGCHGSRDARKSECKEPAGLKSEYMGKTLILRKTGLSVCVSWRASAACVWVLFVFGLVIIHINYRHLFRGVSV